MITSSNKFIIQHIPVWSWCRLQIYWILCLSLVRFRFLLNGERISSKSIWIFIRHRRCLRLDFLVVYLPLFLCRIDLLANDSWIVLIFELSSLSFSSSSTCMCVDIQCWSRLIFIFRQMCEKRRKSWKYLLTIKLYIILLRESNICLSAVWLRRSSHLRVLFEFAC